MSRNEDAVRQIEDLLVSDRASTMLICIHGGRGTGIYGEICSCYLREAVEFKGVGDLILRLDGICNWLGTPSYTTEPRFLNKEMEKRHQAADSVHPEIVRDKQMGGLEQIPFRQALKAREVLVVYIKYRQNSSMQGSIRGKLTQGQIVNFRSGLELMRMLCMIQT